ncbi:MAG TPA: hypothetical protein GX720_04355 [Clostridiaceae bacterium]|nr:hypothetical protein [Clostridiaceae bacterium]
MSEDNKSKGDVRQREIKPRGSSEGSRRPSQKSREGQGGQRSRQRRKPQGNKPQGNRPQGSRQRAETSGKPQSERKPQEERKPQKPKTAEAQVSEEIKNQSPRETEGTAPRKTSSKKRSRRGNRPDPAFRAEETVDDVVRDISRIEKDIQIDIDSIRNLKLDI